MLTFWLPKLDVGGSNPLARFDESQSQRGWLSSNLCVLRSDRRGFRGVFARKRSEGRPGGSTLSDLASVALAKEAAKVPRRPDEPSESARPLHDAR